MAPGLRLREVTIMGAGDREVASGAGPETIDAVVKGMISVVVLVILAVPVTEVDSVVFGPEVADGEDTSIEVATPAVEVTTGTTEGGGPLTDVITAGALRNVDGRMTISPSSGRYGSHSQGISSQPDLPASRQDSSQSRRNAMEVSIHHRKTW